MKAEILKQEEALAVIEENKIAKKTGAEIMQTFGSYSAQAAPLAEEAAQLEIADIYDTDAMERARRIRLDLRAIRVEADHKRKELKEEALAYNKVVQSVFNILEADIKGTEKALLDKERYAELIAEQAVAKKRAERESIAQRYAEFIPQNMDLGTMTDQQFTVLLEGAKTLLKQQEDEKAREAEKQRIEKLKTSRWIEQADVKAFWPQKEWDEIGTLSEGEYKQLAEGATMEKEQREAILRDERARLAKAEAEAKAEQKAREKAEKEAQAAKEKAEEEAKKRREAEKAQQVAETQAQIVSEQKPEPVKKTKAPSKKPVNLESDWDTLMEVAEACRGMAIPKCKTQEAENCRQAVEGLLVKVANFIEERKKAAL